jgi:hypothetical protein
MAARAGDVSVDHADPSSGETMKLTRERGIFAIGVLRQVEFMMKNGVVYKH